MKNRKRSGLCLEGLPNPVHITADNTHPLLDGEEGIKKKKDEKKNEKMKREKKREVRSREGKYREVSEKWSIKLFGFQKRLTDNSVALKITLPLPPHSLSPSPSPTLHVPSLLVFFSFSLSPLNSYIPFFFSSPSSSSPALSLHNFHHITVKSQASKQAGRFSRGEVIVACLGSYLDNPVMPFLALFAYLNWPSMDIT